jgi:glycosyltransferase involved in cell wall biosynthesis
MRILMLSYEFPPLGGGGAKVVAGLSRELVRNGHEVDLVTMGFRGLPEIETVNGVTVYRVPCLRKRTSMCTPLEMSTFLLSAVPKVIRLIRRRGYDLNHTHFIFPDGVIALIARIWTGLDYVLTAHGSDVPGYNPNRFRVEHRLLSPLWNAITRRAFRITCPSETLKSLIRKQNPDLPVEVIPNGIDLGKFKPDRPKHKRILMVTRMFERKGVQHVIRALEDLKLDHEVNIAGDGPYLETVKTLASNLKVKANFWGHLANDSPRLIDLYETSDIFILASESENFPIVLLEAMASSSAIITTRETGCAEVVGDAGVLVNPSNLHELRQALVRLMEDPELRNRLGKRARMRLENRFAWSVVSRQYLLLYAGLRNETGKPVKSSEDLPPDGPSA